MRETQLALCCKLFIVKVEDMAFQFKAVVVSAVLVT